MMKNPSLESYTIKFLYNLSFDMTICDDILKVGLLPKITDLIGMDYIKIVIDFNRKYFYLYNFVNPTSIIFKRIFNYNLNLHKIIL